MYNEYLLFGTIIPSAEYLYDSGLVDKIWKFYKLDYDKFQKKYPLLKEYNQDMVPLYALYLEICNRCVYNSNENYQDVVCEIKENSTNMREFLDNMLRDLSDLTRDFNVNSNNVEENYERYKHEQLEVYNSNPKVIKFMEQTSTKQVETAVRNYLLSNQVKLGSVGLDLSHEEEINKLVYVTFEHIYRQYCEMCKYNPILKHMFKRNMFYTNQELVNQYINNFLDNLNDFLFTLDEYKDYIKNRKIYGCSILDITDAQFNLDHASARVRKDEEL